MGRAIQLFRRLGRLSEGAFPQPNYRELDADFKDEIKDSLSELQALLELLRSENEQWARRLILEEAFSQLSKLELSIMIKEGL